MSSVGFEYTNKKTETPFETFLRYTDEKEKSAEKLAGILQATLHKGSRILDVGTGNGEYLNLALSKIDIPEAAKLTLVEPSNDLAGQLASRFERLLPPDRLEVVDSDLQGFASEGTYDVILMSHLFYHIPRPTWTEQLGKALSLLKQNGVLIIVLREKDDAYDFKMKFKPLLFDVSFKALTIDDVTDALPQAMTLNVSKQIASSELKIPFDTNSEDTISIIEFYLNKQWQDIPSGIQQEVLAFIKNKKGVLKQLDGIAVVEKAE